jgi:hypothetical protein
MSSDIQNDSNGTPIFGVGFGAEDRPAAEETGMAVLSTMTWSGSGAAPHD